MKHFSDYVKEIEQFYRDSGVEIDPAPKIKLDLNEADRFDPFIPTGHYEPGTATIVLHVGGRQLKDILRSLCHELVHHNQAVSGMFNQADDVDGSLEENARLTELETDAYSRGNILFRKWTEQASRDEK